MTHPPVSRRTALALLASSLTSTAFAADPPRRTGMGLVLYCQGFLRKQLQQQKSINLFEPMRFLRRCRELGTGGMQANLGVLSRDDALALRRQAEQWDMYIEAIVASPADAAALERFDAEMNTAKQCGALAARTTIMPGRRYEQFSTLDEFKKYEALGQQKLERAAPIAEKYRLPLAVENHKDQRIDERLALFKHISSEFVGACVDTGNSFALIEDALETVAALAPWAFSVHLKDQAVREYPDGFLFADISLGRGMFDLKKMVATLRAAKPKVRFSLELITRDPLKVPCLTDAYWATFDNVPARDLARTLRTVRQRSAKSLPTVSTLPLNQQVAAEAANVETSIAYAAEVLHL